MAAAIAGHGWPCIWAAHHGVAVSRHMAWLPFKLPLGLLLLLSLLAITAHAATYNVGGASRTWRQYTYTEFSFQRWADGIDWYSGDVLAFDYNENLHDVWQFEDRGRFLGCSFNLGKEFYSKSVELSRSDPGTYDTIYFGSSKGDDCESGMKFSLTYYTCSSCSSPPPADPSPPPPSISPPPPSPPPPSLPPPSPRPPPPLGGSSPSYRSGSSEDSKKTSVPVAAIAVPIVVVVVLGAGVVGVCCVCRARRRDEADVGPSKPPPDSPVLAFQPAPASPPHSPVLAFQPAPVPVVVPGPPPPVFNGMPRRPPPPAPNVSGVHGFGPTSATSTPVLAV